MILLTGVLLNDALMFPRCLVSLLLAFLIGVAIAIHREAQRRPFVVITRQARSDMRCPIPVE